ncbi:MAG: DUF4157 domain-containing protein [Acidimicrobiia bacterium]|nr:DUF4157 domain-containing protein [Acidimicrobiia bacterium]
MKDLVANRVEETAGRPLPPSEREWLESSFGGDLSHVRLHDGPAARAEAAEHGAAAMALGTDVVLGGGAASPLSRRAILAHEVAHVVQQSAPGAASTAALESDANHAAGRALLGAPGGGPSLRGGLQLQRCDGPHVMSEAELAQYIAANHFRVVVTQPTERFLSGMKKSVAVAANPEPSVSALVEQEADELITAGFDFPKIRGVNAEVPFPDGSRQLRPLAMHSATGTFTLTFMFPGRYDITAYVMFTPGQVHQFHQTIEVAQADFEGDSDAAAPAHLAGQAAYTPEQERLAWILQRAEIRSRAVRAGVLDANVASTWTQLSVAIVARAAALQDSGTGPGTATALDDAVRAFEGAFDPVPAALALSIGVMKTRAYSTDVGRLRSSAEALAAAFDVWVLERLSQQEGGSELATAFRHGMAVERAVGAIAERAHGPAVRIPAVFHAQSSYVRRELFVSGPISTGQIQAVPLNLWLFSEGGRDWTLRDVSNPEESFEYDTDNDDRDAALDNLLRQLTEDEERFPTGRLHVQPPGRDAVAFAIESDMDPLDWIAIAALILAAAGIIMVTAGAATPGVVAAGGYLLTASAVAGGGMAIADTVDAYERGRLTGKRLAINALQLVASAASAGTSTIFANAARSGSNLALLGSNARYVVLNRAAAGADVVTLLVMGGDTAVQLAGIGGDGARDDQAAMRAALAIGQLLVQGTLTVVSARDAFHGDLSTHPPIELHEGSAGAVVRNIGAGAVDTPGATGPRTLEDLLAPGGSHFSTDHAAMRSAYDDYRARAVARNETPLDPLDWAKFQSQGRAADYLNDTLPEGWRAARRAQYPGSRPELIDRPSNSPMEGSIDPTTGRRWRYRRVTVDEIRPEVDAAGDPYWTFPDLVDGEVLLLPSGTRVWREAPTGATVEEHPVGPSVSSHRTRTAGESTLMSRGDMGPAHVAAGTERAHGAGSPGLGFDSPYGVAHASARVNQVLENNGMERYMRNLRDNAPPGVTYLYTTRTYRSGPNLQQRVYDIAAIEGGTVHRMFQFKVVVEGGLGDEAARFVADETSVFAGATTYGAPTLRTQPADAPAGGVGVNVPAVLRDEMGRVTVREAPTASPITRPLEQSQSVRGRLDDVMEGRIRAGQLDQTWMDAHERAMDALQNAETRIANASVCTADVEELRAMLTDLARRSGRHPHTVDARRLNDFADRVNGLQLD